MIRAVLTLAALVPCVALLGRAPGAASRTMLRAASTAAPPQEEASEVMLNRRLSMEWEYMLQKLIDMKGGEVKYVESDYAMIDDSLLKFMMYADKVARETDTSGLKADKFILPDVTEAQKKELEAIVSSDDPRKMMKNVKPGSADETAIATMVEKDMARQRDAMPPVAAPSDPFEAIKMYFPSEYAKLELDQPLPIQVRQNAAYSRFETVRDLFVAGFSGDTEGLYAEDKIPGLEGITLKSEGANIDGLVTPIIESYSTKAEVLRKESLAELEAVFTELKKDADSVPKDNQELYTKVQSALSDLEAFVKDRPALRDA